MIRSIGITSIVFWVTFVLTQCRPPEKKTEVVPDFVSGVYVINEGIFQVGNSSISYFDERNGHLTNDVFFAANGYELGDVCQYMIQIGAYYYIVVNGSGRIEVVDASTFKVVTAITECQSPRYILPLSSSKAYVTDLYDNKVHVLNLATQEITGHISIPTWTESIVYANDKVFVSAPASEYLLIIDPTKDALIDSIEVGQGVSSMVVDKNNKLWVLSNGNLGANSSFIAKINVSNNEVELLQNLDHRAESLRCSGDLANLYWLEEGVVKLHVDSIVSYRKKIVAKGSHSWYGLGIHPFTNDVYVSDVYDFLQNSDVFIYSQEGNYKFKFRAGLVSNGFCFKGKAM